MFPMFTLLFFTVNKPKFKGSRQKIVILTTISSYLFIVSLLVACNHNMDLFILSGMPNYCHLKNQVINGKISLR